MGTNAMHSAAVMAMNPASSRLVSWNGIASARARLIDQGSRRKAAPSLARRDPAGDTRGFSRVRARSP